jgi:hypothetical protein
MPLLLLLLLLLPLLPFAIPLLLLRRSRMLLSCR